MNSETFTYWLQGFVELTESDTISEKQWLVIKDHLKLVFDRKTPVRTPDRQVQGEPINWDTVRPKPIDLVDKQFEWWQQNPVQITC